MTLSGTSDIRLCNFDQFQNKGKKENEKHLCVPFDEVFTIHQFVPVLWTINDKAIMNLEGIAHSQTPLSIIVFKNPL